MYSIKYRAFWRKFLDFLLFPYPKMTLYLKGGFSSFNSLSTTSHGWFIQKNKLSGTKTQNFTFCQTKQPSSDVQWGSNLYVYTAHCLSVYTNRPYPTDSDHVYWDPLSAPLSWLVSKEWMTHTGLNHCNPRGVNKWVGLRFVSSEM